MLELLIKKTLFIKGFYETLFFYNAYLLFVRQWPIWYGRQEGKVSITDCRRAHDHWQA